MDALIIIGKILFGAAFSGLIHYYLWRRLVRPISLPRRWQRAIGGLLVTLWAAIPVTTWMRVVWPEFSAVVGWITLPWMALGGLIFVCLLAIDVGRLAVWCVRRASDRPDDDFAAARRTFLARMAGGTAVMVGSTSTVRGMIEARGTHEVTDVEVTLAKLPRSLDGFTIVQLTDLHVGLTIDREFVQRVVDRTNHLAPDLIALTGDFVDGRVESLRDDIEPLRELRAKHGIYAVTGNHEYYSGADPWIAEITRLGVRYLRNERVTIGNGEGAFELIGVDDHTASGDGHGEDFAKATAGRDPTRALVALAHQPRQVRRAAKHGVDLQLSGHTHGGQIWPWHYIVRFQQGGLLAGRYEYEGTQLYVSRGCGYWGPPVRVLAPLEITRIILRAPAA